MSCSTPIAETRLRGERALAKQESYSLNTFVILCIGLKRHNCHVFEPLQRPLDVGPTALTLESFSLALLCTLLACPAVQLLSLLFRYSKVLQLCGPGLLRRPHHHHYCEMSLLANIFASQEARGHLQASPQWPLRGVKTETPQGMAN